MKLKRKIFTIILVRVKNFLILLAIQVKIYNDSNAFFVGKIIDELSAITIGKFSSLNPKMCSTPESHSSK